MCVSRPKFPDVESAPKVAPAPPKPSETALAVDSPFAVQDERRLAASLGTTRLRVPVTTLHIPR